MSRYLDPRSDVVFKKIFGEHPHLLKSFLNAVLPLEEDQKIVELFYISGEQIPLIPILKRTFVDVKCKDIQGRSFIVEMQIEWSHSFKQRLLFSSSQAIVKQLKKGEDYHLLQPVYGLGIISDKYDPDEKSWYHHYKLVETEANHQKSCIEHLQLILIELPKFKVETKEHKHLRLLWLRFLREINEDTQKIPKEFLEVDEIAKAIELAEEAAYTETELWDYESYWKAISSEKTLLKERLDKGIQIGMAKGEAIGMEKGEAIGMEKGRTEAVRHMAKSMRDKGIAYETICAITGLSKEEIYKV